MLKFKAFCLDYWQFLCLQPLHGVYRRYVKCPLLPLPTARPPQGGPVPLGQWDCKAKFTVSLLTVRPPHP